MTRRGAHGADNVARVLHFQGRTQQWLARQTGISVDRIGRLLAGEYRYRDWEAEQVALALQVPRELLFPSGVTITATGRQSGTARESDLVAEVAS
jgi:hypothetical protein